MSGLDLFRLTENVRENSPENINYSNNAETILVASVFILGTNKFVN